MFHRYLAVFSTAVQKYGGIKQLHSDIEEFIRIRAERGYIQDRPTRRFLNILNEMLGKEGEEVRTAALDYYQRTILNKHQIILDTGTWFHIYPTKAMLKVAEGPKIDPDLAAAEFPEAFPTSEIVPTTETVFVPIEVAPESLTIEEPVYISKFVISPVRNGRTFYPSIISSLIASMKHSGNLPKNASGKVTTREIIISGVTKAQADILGFAVAKRAKMQVYTLIA